jgi:hypothetical protein
MRQLVKDVLAAIFPFPLYDLYHRALSNQLHKMNFEYVVISILD